MAASRKPFRPSVRYGLNATPGMEAPEAATQTYKKGAILVASVGYVQEGGADPTAIIGIADRDGQNGAAAGSKKVQYTPAFPMLAYEASIDTNAALGTGAIVATDLYAEYGITKDANGIWYVDKAKVGVTGRVRIVQFIDPVGAVMGRVLVTFSFDSTIYAQT